MTKGKRPNNVAQIKPAELALPKHIQLSNEEKSIVARLIRVLREPDYWLGAFVESLLIADTEVNPGIGITVKEATKLLETIDGVLSWSDKLDSWREQNSPMMRFYAHRFFPDRADLDRQDGRKDSEDGDFAELTRLWRLNHPEPPKPRASPKGRTQHEEDPDTD